MYIEVNISYIKTSCIQKHYDSINFQHYKFWLMSYCTNLICYLNHMHLLAYIIHTIL